MNNNLNLTYASVLFDIAYKNNAVSTFWEYGKKLFTVIREFPQFSTMINNLNISKDERKQIIQDIWLEQTSLDFMYFLWSIVDFNHTRKLKVITQHFLQLCQQHLHISYFQITSAYELNDQEMKELEHAIIQKFHKHKIILRNVVDKTVIGGIKIKSNSYCIDNTLKNKLNLMRDNIKSTDSIRR